MLPLFEQGGGGKAKRGIDRVSVLPEQATRACFHSSQSSGRGSDFVTTTCHAVARLFLLSFRLEK